MFPRLFVSPLPHIYADALSCIPAFLRRSWFGSPPVCCRMPIRQYVSTYVRQCISTYVCQYISGAVCLSVRADLPFQMSVSVHVHLFALLLHRFCPQRNIQIRRSVSFPPLRGSIWLRSGSLWHSSAPSRLVFPPYLCTQAAGQRSRCAHRTPVPSFFWAAGRYRSPDTFGVGYRQVYPQSVVYGFLCPRRHSKVSFELLKGFPVTPGNDLAPCGGGLPLRSREACFLPAVCVPEAALVP